MVKNLDNFMKNSFIKVIRLKNPCGNRWKNTKTLANISEDGLQAKDKCFGYTFVYASHGFSIFGETLRKDHFPGTIAYYFEVTQMSANDWLVGGIWHSTKLRNFSIKLKILKRIRINNFIDI
jgi:hypothetical protein